MPRIAINNGYCFAGNAALFGCADITIATRKSWIGMAGPAMIEGGGLGVFRPTEIGPIDVQTKNGVVDTKTEKKITEQYRQRIDIKTPSMEQRVINLSGGNQQKVVLAKSLATESDILIFDEPTRGIDVGAKQEIYQLMCELADNGNAILMISSDMEELLGMSDRIIVLSEGRLAGEVQKEQFSQDHILDLASGRH